MQGGMLGKCTILSLLNSVSFVQWRYGLLFRAFAFIFLHPRSPNLSHWPLPSWGHHASRQWVIWSLLHNDAAFVHSSIFYACPPCSSRSKSSLFTSSPMIVCLMLNFPLFQKHFSLIFHFCFSVTPFHVGDIYSFYSSSLFLPFSHFPNCQLHFSLYPSSTFCIHLLPYSSSFTLSVINCLHLAMQLFRRNGWKHRRCFPPRTSACLLPNPRM